MVARVPQGRVLCMTATRHGPESVSDATAGSLGERVEQDLVSIRGFRVKPPGFVRIDRGERPLGEDEGIVLAVRSERKELGWIVVVFSDD